MTNPNFTVQIWSENTELERQLTLYPCDYCGGSVSEPEIITYDSKTLKLCGVCAADTFYYLKKRLRKIRRGR